MSTFSPISFHLFQAYRNWLLENKARIDIIVDNNKLGSDILSKYQDAYGCVRLNISPEAANNWYSSTDGISFDARFGDKSHRLDILFSEILGVLYKGPDDNNYYVPLHPQYETSEIEVDASPVPPPKGRPVLKVVK